MLFHTLELIDALGLDRFALVGHSVGGWIAAELAVRHPERVTKLVLIDACGLFVAGAKISPVVYAIPVLPVGSILLALLPATRRWARPG